jgi:hypothetical protein
MADDAETDGDGLIRQVQQILGPTTAAAQFAALLYGRNGSHELEGLAPTRLARDAAGRRPIAEKPRTGKNGFRRMAGPADGPPATTVLEVINDDMPFPDRCWAVAAMRWRSACSSIRPRPGATARAGCS